MRLTSGKQTALQSPSKPTMLFGLHNQYADTDNNQCFLKFKCLLQLLQKTFILNLSVNHNRLKV